MKVLHVTSNIDPLAGGPARALVGLVLAQQRAGLECKVLSTWQGTLNRTFFNVLREASIPVTLVGPCRPPLKWHPDLSTALDQSLGDADIIHIHALWEEVQHRAAAKSRKRSLPYIFRTCGMLDPWSLSQSRLTKKLYLEMRLRRDLNGAAAIHFTSDEERALAQPIGLLAPTLVVENGIDLTEFRDMPARGLFRKSIPQIGERRIVLALSRIHPKKGFDLLIPAFAKARLENAVLVIAGHDDVNHTPELLKLIHAGNVSDRVILAGPLDSQRRLQALADADLFVLPSYQENFGIAVVEAAAAGLPCIVSETVNIQRELVAAGAGDVVRLDPADIADKLGTWMSDSARRADAGRRGREFAFGRFDWNPIAARWAHEYEHIISTAKAHCRT
ncbi:glycosyltransferase [Candidatus Sumerlaeota bacterium]|nr:glycosyltransferase [Candidatus Sumerlaeota bacterium]